MRVAVVSDIHANLHALEAVLEAIDADPPDELWCLGDLVGYGPRPNEVADLIRERARLCLVGNHDLGVLGRLDLEEFSPDAAAVVRWTQTVLLDENRTYLDSLKPQAKVERAELFHASPRDPVWEYVISEETALAALEMTVSPLVLVGHSHVALSVSLTNGDLSGAVAPDGTEAPTRRRAAGSSIQARSGSRATAIRVLHGSSSISKPGPRASTACPYDIARTQSELRERDLPEALAERLGHGA